MKPYRRPSRLERWKQTAPDRFTRYLDEFFAGLAELGCLVDLAFYLLVLGAAMYLFPNLTRFLMASVQAFWWSVVG
jgi:hypothetical protein